jgi:hypothetical protein
MGVSAILSIVGLVVGELPAIESLVINGIEMFNQSWTAEQQLQALSDAKVKLVKIDHVV